jgi:diguanylate cyclase (GGDEF)-like protein
MGTVDHCPTGTGTGSFDVTTPRSHHLRVGVVLASGLSVLPLAALPSSTATSTAWLMHLVALCCALVLMVRASRHGDAAVRRSRTLYSAALATSLAGSLVAVGYVAATGRIPVPSLGDPVALFYIPLAVAACLVLPQRDAARIGRLRLAADGVVAASALLFASWVTVIEPVISSGRHTPFAVASQVAYPLGDVFVAAMVFALLPRVRTDLRPFLNWVAVGLLFIGFSNSGYVAHIAAHGATTYGWPDVTFQMGLAALAVAAGLRPATAVLPGSDDAPSAMDRNLPYVPVAVAFAVGMWHIAQEGGLDRADSTFAAVMFFCVLARQALLARDLSSISDVHRYAAHHDALTGLANRKRFLARLDEHLDTPGRAEAALVLLDLDGFKEVNDTLGHEAGDGVLRWFAELLVGAAQGALVARLGGDEFAVLVIGTGAADSAAALAHRADAGMGGADDCGLGVRCSAGVTSVRHGDSAADVLRRADLAMYSAKKSTSSRVVDFSEGLAQQAERRSRLSNDLVGAMDRGELHLVYQPLYRLGDGALAGAEALLRWTHPLWGAVPPDEFIPIAEECGQISIVGAWVLEEAVGQVTAWERAGRYLPCLYVNVSALEFTADLSVRVADVLRRQDVDGSRLVLEVTESQVPGLAANGAMQALRASGVRIALDDFGAGYSSLAQLARLPVDVLKIDRDFLRTIGDSTGRAVMDAVIGLARALGLGTVAEGIEDLGQAAEVSNAGVDLGQGFLFRRPEEPDVLAALLPTVEPVLPVLPLEPSLAVDSP